jgi:uncharacterized membrane protein
MEAYNVLIYIQLFHIIVIIYQSSKSTFQNIEKKTNLLYIFNVKFWMWNYLDPFCALFER